MSTNSRVSIEVKFQCMGSVIQKSEAGHSVVDRKPDAVQKDNSNVTSPSTDHNLRCLSSGLEQPVRYKQQEVHGQQRNRKTI